MQYPLRRSKTITEFFRERKAILGILTFENWNLEFFSEHFFTEIYSFESTTRKERKYIHIIESMPRCRGSGALGGTTVWIGKFWRFDFPNGKEVPNFCRCFPSMLNLREIGSAKLQLSFRKVQRWNNVFV